MRVKKLQMKTIKLTVKIQACLILCQGYIPENVVQIKIVKVQYEIPI